MHQWSLGKLVAWGKSTQAPGAFTCFSTYVRDLEEIFQIPWSSYTQGQIMAAAAILVLSNSIRNA